MADINLQSESIEYTLESSLVGLVWQLGCAEQLAADLRSWLATVDAETYEKKWTPEMDRAYKAYKDKGKAHSDAHKAFMDHRSRYKRDLRPEQLSDRWYLAVWWGEAAVAAGDCRLQFIKSYKNAYGSTTSIETHIQAGEAALRSGRTAVSEAQRNYEAIYNSWARSMAKIQVPLD